jgi:hypothetical protein
LLGLLMCGEILRDEHLNLQLRKALITRL